MANHNVILQWNCAGLNSKRTELDNLIKEHSPAVICLQEILMHPDVERNRNDKSFANIRHYKGYFKCIPTGRNGIAIYVKKKWCIPFACTIEN